MGQWLKQSTAVTVKIGPFVDDTDGKTAETGLTLSQADIRLSKNGGNMAQKNESSAATHDEIGWYDCALDTTDTNTLGRLVLMVHESGALPVWHEYMVMPANVYDSLVSGSASDYLDVSVVQLAGSAIDQSGGLINANVKQVSGDATAADNLEAACDGTTYNIGGGAVVAASVTGAVGSVTGAVGSVTGNVGGSVGSVAAGGITAASIATDAIDADALAADAIAEINATVDTAISDAALATAAALATVDGIVDAILLDTAEIGAAGAGLTAVPWNAAWDAEVQSEATDALNAYDPPTKAELDAGFAALNDLSAADVNAEVDTALADYDPPTKAELDAAVANVSVDEIQASALADLFNTDSGTTYGAAVAGSVVKEIADNAGGSALTAADIADAVWDEASTGHTDAGKAGAQLWTDIDAILEDTGTTLQAELDGIQADTEDLQAQIGAAGAGLTAVPWNAAWDAEVQSEATDALNAYDPPTKAELDAGFAALNDLSAAEVNAEVDTALADYDPPTKAELDAAVAPLATSAEIGALNDVSSADVEAAVTTVIGAAGANLTAVALASDGLDAISTTAPAGVASNFREMLVQTWRRWFGKSTMTTSQLKTYADNGTDVLTTQALSDDGTTQTLGAAS